MPRARTAVVLTLLLLALALTWRWSRQPTAAPEPPPPRPASPAGPRPAGQSPSLPSPDPDLPANTRVDLVDAQGRPAARCPYLLVVDAAAGEADGASESTGEVPADGALALRLPRGTAILSVDCRSRGFGQLVFPSPSAAERLELEPPAVLSVRVLREDGRPVAGAEVSFEVEAWGRPWLRSVASALGPHLLRLWSPRRTTDVAGEAELALPPVSGVVRARAGASRAFTERDDFEPGGVEPELEPASQLELARASAPVDLRARSQRVELVLPDGLALAGTVLDDRGAAAAGAAVTVQQYADPGDGSADDVDARLKADATGAFRATGLAPRPVALVATLGELRAHARALPGKDVVLRLERPRVVTGRVVDEGGAPVALFFANHQTHRAPDGRFVLEVPRRAEELRVTVWAAGFAQRHLAVKPGPGVTDLGQVALERGHTVRGVVVDAASQAPVAGAGVEVAPPWAGHGEQLWSVEPARGAKTDPAGRFELANAAADGVLHATAPGYRPKEQSAEGAELRVALDRGASLTVTLLDATGQRRLAAAEARLVDRTRQLVAATPRSNPFELAGLSAGSWQLFALARDCEGGRCLDVRYDPAEVTLGEGERRELSLTPPRGVEVRFAWLGAAPAGRVWSMLLAGRVALPQTLGAWQQLGYTAGRRLEADGRFHAVPPGPYTFFAWRMLDGQRVAFRAEVTVTGERDQLLEVAPPSAWEPLGFFDVE